MTARPHTIPHRPPGRSADTRRRARPNAATAWAPGIRRLRAGRGFRYVADGGAPVHDAATLQRIRALGIPPAWTDVRVAASPRARIQAIGRDSRGRAQYRYHPRWRRRQDSAKFRRMLAFAEALPVLRQRVATDLRQRGVPRERVLALVVWLLERTLIRVGHATYTRENGSYGLTTLDGRHVRVDGASLTFRFRGKGGIRREVTVRDRRIAALVRRCRDLPGRHVFRYEVNGEPRTLDAAAVNQYIREATGGPFTAKDFRTWAGTVACAAALARAPRPSSPVAARRSVAAAVRAAAGRLGNTPAVCRSSYVDPAVIAAFEQGRLCQEHPPDRRGGAGAPEGLLPDEAAVLQLLKGQSAGA